MPSTRLLAAPSQSGEKSTLVFSVMIQSLAMKAGAGPAGAPRSAARTGAQHKATLSTDATPTTLKTVLPSQGSPVRKGLVQRIRNSQHIGATHEANFGFKSCTSKLLFLVWFSNFEVPTA